MRYYLFILFCLYIYTAAYSQLPKANVDLVEKWNDFNFQPALDGEKMIGLFLYGQLKDIQSQLDELGVLTMIKTKSSQVIKIPLKNVGKLAEIPSIHRIEYHPSSGKVLNDSVRVNTVINPVHNGEAPLTQAYSGQGTIIGVIDAGIDLDHPDFQKEDSTTRILYLWDQRAAIGSNTPVEYGYGQAWDKEEIDAGLCTHNDQANNSGNHGSHVTGIATGNARANGRNKGVAPDADIIFVVYKSSNFLLNVTTAMDYIFNKAEALGKPCVINTSIGTLTGSRDADDLPSKVVENLLNEENVPARAVTAAVGNYGDEFFHLGYEVTASTGFTWFKENNKRILFDLYADSSEFNRVSFSLGANDPSSNFSDKGNMPFINVRDHLSLHINTTADETFEIYKLGDFVGRVRIIGDRFDERYTLRFEVTIEEPSWYWRFTTKGEGRFDIWSGQLRMNTSDMVTEGLPEESAFPGIVYYKVPDNNKTLVSGWTCSEDVITVGMYENRDGYYDVNSNWVANGNPSGQINATSSLGPNRRGYQKPEVVAPGSYVISAAPLWLGNYLAEGGFHYRSTGSSMAAPVVAGLVALYFEKYPETPHQDIIRCLTATTYEDNYTDPDLPNNLWGYGKPNGLEFLQCKVGCMDETALNYDPEATINGYCEFDNVVNLLNKSPFRIYPNPSSGLIRIQAGENRKENYQVEIFDLHGKYMMLKKVDTENIFSQTLDLGHFAKGIYFVRIKNKENILQYSRIIIQ